MGFLKWIYGNLVKSEVLEVDSVICYSIIVYGTLDASYTEQITSFLRYVHHNDNNSKMEECFLQYQDSEKKNGSDITEMICQVLGEQNKHR